jgi:hypothetical protein
VAYPFVAYLDRRTLHYMAPYLLLAIIALLATLLFARLMPLSGLLSAGARRRRVASVWLPRLLGGGAGLALGLFGFGNLLIGRTAGLAGEPQRLWGLRILTRPVETALSTSVVDMFGPYEGAGPLISHLDGPMDFLARFGVVFLLSAGALAVLWRGRPTDGAGEAAAPSSRVGETRLLTLLVFFALAFMTALFVYDFMVGHVRDQLAHWVRSRLLEPWFYGVLFLGLVALRRTFPRRGGTLAFSLVCLWMLKTMLIHPGLAVRQWAVNASYFVREILGWGA